MKKLACLMIAFMMPLVLFAQDEKPRSGETPLYDISMELKLSDGVNRQSVSDSRVNHVTFAGKPVALNINGGNFKASILLTLYHQESGSLVLLTQSRVVSTGEEKRALATAKSIPVELGEKILFFPLGMLSKLDNGSYNCILELQVSQHQK